MEEARRDDGAFDGIVGFMDPRDITPNTGDIHSLRWFGNLLLYSYIVGMMHLAIVGGLSGFHSTNSNQVRHEDGRYLSW